jgi:hypothetical protein
MIRDPGYDDPGHYGPLPEVPKPTPFKVGRFLEQIKNFPGNLRKNLLGMMDDMSLMNHDLLVVQPRTEAPQALDELPPTPQL